MANSSGSDRAQLVEGRQPRGRVERVAAHQGDGVEVGSPTPDLLHQVDHLVVVVRRQHGVHVDRQPVDLAQPIERLPGACVAALALAEAVVGLLQAVDADGDAELAGTAVDQLARDVDRPVGEPAVGRDVDHAGVERADDRREVIAQERLAAADVEPEQRTDVASQALERRQRQLVAARLEVDEAVPAAEVAPVGDVDDQVLRVTAQQIARVVLEEAKRRRRLHERGGLPGDRTEGRHRNRPRPRREVRSSRSVGCAALPTARRE